MSWLSDIAGKAEDFLNKMDQSAATALQKPTSSPKVVSSALYSPPLQPSNYISPTVTSGLSLAQKKSPATVPSSLTSRPKAPKDEDERLLEFLNSSDNISAGMKKESLKVPGSEILVSGQDVVSKTENQREILEAVKTDAVSEVVSEPSVEVISGTSSIATLNTSENDSQSQNASVTAFSTSFVDAKDDESRLQQLETENQLLQKEVCSLNQEIASLLQRAKNAELEKKHLQNRMDHWNNQVSSSDSLIRELQARERDLSSALEAKDSQLAVLRVRLQEADQELQGKKELFDRLRSDNERLLKDQTESSHLKDQAVNGLRQKLQELENALRKEQENYRSLQAESMHRQSQLEEEVRNLAENLTISQKQVSDQKAHNKDLCSQVTSLKSSFETSRQELNDYKQKAQRILQSKEKLISSLKDTSGNITALTEGDYTASSAELELMTQECEHLKMELKQAQSSINSLQAEMQEQENNLHRENETMQEQQRALLEDLRSERKLRQDFEIEVRQMKEEIRFLKEDTNKTKVSLQQRISERDSEIDRLRSQLTMKALSSTSESELETRLHTLTESLIQKQTLVEALSTEKNSLVLQLERLEQQLKEAQLQGARSHTAVVGLGHSDENVKSRVPGFFLESPYDSSMTRKVKRAYGVIDSFSIRLGLFLRRYPLARVFIILYMCLLHLWVMIVLLTYQPEIHGHLYNQNKTK